MEKVENPTIRTLDLSPIKVYFLGGSVQWHSIGVLAYQGATLSTNWKPVMDENSLTKKVDRDSHPVTLHAPLKKMAQLVHDFISLNYDLIFYRCIDQTTK